MQSGTVEGRGCTPGIPTASSEDEGRCETMAYHGALCCRLGSWSIVASLM